MKKIICSGCGKAFTEDAIPEKCPVCGCDSSFFKEEQSSDERMESTSNDSNGKSNSVVKALICIAIGVAIFLISSLDDGGTEIATLPLSAGFVIVGVWLLVR